MLNEVIELLNIKSNGNYIDCTGGMGGHSSVILEHLSDEGQLSIVDYHLETVNLLKEKFKTHKNVSVYHGRFSEIFDKLDDSFDGILADFGISSPQLSDPNLGIGFLTENAPLDMRIDKNLEESAKDILMTRSKEELADIFYYFGGEKQSRRIASAIVFDREQDKTYETTTALRELCERVLGRFYFKKKIHPATKVFQALRIAVNKELEEVEAFLNKAPKKLTLEGRLVVISFHEGEDRLAKNVFKSLSFKSDEFSLPVKKAIKPTKQEIEFNPRSRSARLRVLERSKV